MKDWLKTKEAGEQVGRSPETIARWARDGIIPCKIVPGSRPSYLIHRDFVEALPGNANSAIKKPSVDLEALEKIHGAQKKT